MSQLVKIKVRAHQPVHFPALCVHCARPSSTWLSLNKRIGRITRLIDVPLCTDCEDALHRLSGDEERVKKLGNLIAGLTFLLTFAVALLLIPAAMSLALRSLISVSLAVFLAEIVLIVARRYRRRAALPEKQAIYQSARIRAFSWRATTFEFVNESFAQSFRSLNEALLMES
jgi:hypothetical protein